MLICGYSDGIGVGVMLDCARVLIERNKHITGSAIFLFNGAEGTYTAPSCTYRKRFTHIAVRSIETLQDASHLYSMEHETKDLYADFYGSRSGGQLRLFTVSKQSSILKLLAQQGVHCCSKQLVKKWLRLIARFLDHTARWSRQTCSAQVLSCLSKWNFPQSYKQKMY